LYDFSSIKKTKQMATSSDSTTDLASTIENTLLITENDLSDLIKIQGDIVRKLKTEKAPKDKIDEAVKKLLDLKKQHADKQGGEGEEGAASGEKLLKTPRVIISIND
jgi:hypothetical protein